MGERWPSMQASRVAAVLEKVCGRPLRQGGSHRQFARPDGGGTFTVAFHDRETIPGGKVRRILLVDVGLSIEHAREMIR